MWPISHYDLPLCPTWDQMTQYSDTKSYTKLCIAQYRLNHHNPRNHCHLTQFADCLFSTKGFYQPSFFFPLFFAAHSDVNLSKVVGKIYASLVPFQSKLCFWKCRYAEVNRSRQTPLLIWVLSIFVVSP